MGTAQDKWKQRGDDQPTQWFRTGQARQACQVELGVAPQYGSVMSCVLAFDLGGSSLRAALVDRAGVQRARFVVGAPVAVERMGWSEADPDDWWRMLCDAADALARQAPDDFATVRAIACSAFTRSQVFIGRDGGALRPAILWRDTRADKLLPALLARCPPDHPETANISVFHPLARLWWLQHEEVATLRATAHVLEPKDYLNLKLTGSVAGDQVSYARLAAAAAGFGATPSLFAAADMPSTLVPALRPPVGVMGRVQPGLPGSLARLAGAAVIAMANDTWASVLGLGAMAPGLAYNLSGTTEVFGIVSSTPASAPGLLAVDWSAGLHQLGGPSQGGGDCVMWLAELIGGEGVGPTAAGAFLDAVLAGPREPEPVLFLPYLQGERVPYWDPHLRGAFIGLNRRHRHPRG